MPCASSGLSFEPLKKHEEEDEGHDGAGSTDVRAPLETLGSSKLPTLLDEFQLDVRFAQTPGGLQPVKLDMKGVGGMLFMKKRFAWWRRHVTFVDQLDRVAPICARKLELVDKRNNRKVPRRGCRSSTGPIPRRSLRAVLEAAERLTR